MAEMRIKNFLLTLTLTFSCWVNPGWSKVNFVKDQSMDAVFPGPVTRQDPSLPEGHMRPLGWQRRADGPLDEYDGMPATNDFYDAYVATNTPVVLRKGLADVPAFKTWKDDEYLVDKYGDLNVTVRVKTGRKRNTIISVEQSMKLKKFLGEYLYEEMHVATLVPDAMMPELPLPGCVRCGTLRDSLWSAELWMSSGGTSSRIHSHDEQLLHCVLFGRRDFIVIESYNRKAFDFIQDFPGSLGGHSDLNTERIDMFQNKMVSRVPWTWASLYAGDCIYVPSGYIHQVRSHSRTISLTIEFAPIPMFDNTGCTLSDDEFAPLNEGEFFWTSDDGKKRLSDETLTLEGLRRLLSALLGSRDVLTFEHFQHFYHQFAPDSDKVPTARQVFDFMLSEEEESVITRIGIMEMVDKDLQRIIDVFNSFTRWDGKMGEGGRAEDRRHHHVHEEF